MERDRIVGYVLSGPDLDQLMFPKREVIDRCSRCGYRLDFDASNPGFECRLGTDHAVTLDQQHVVSQRFRDICRDLQLEGAKLVPLHKDRCFHLTASRVVQFDARRRRTRMLDYCDKCGAYESVVGVQPAFLAIQEPLSRGFWGTDLQFGSGDAKGRRIIVDAASKELLTTSGLAGLEFRPAYGQLVQ
jgi:hypothetical protein